MSLADSTLMLALVSTSPVPDHVGHQLFSVFCNTVRHLSPVCCVLQCLPFVPSWRSRLQNLAQTVASVVAGWHSEHPCWQNRRDMTHRNPVKKEKSAQLSCRCSMDIVNGHQHSFFIVIIYCSRHKVLV